MSDEKIKMTIYANILVDYILYTPFKATEASTFTINILNFTIVNNKKNKDKVCLRDENLIMKSSYQSHCRLYYK